MEELPRLSQYLRAFCDVSASFDKAMVSNQEELVMKRTELEKRNDKMHSLDTIRNAVIANTNLPKEEIKKLLKELGIIAQEIAGSEAPSHVIEGAAVFLLDVFSNCSIVGQKEIQQLRKSFGLIPQDTDKRAFIVVKRIIAGFGIDVQEKIVHKGFQDIYHLCSREEFGSKIKFAQLQPMKKEAILVPVLDLSEENKENVVNALSTLSFKFEADNNEVEYKKPPKVYAPNQRRIDQQWLENQIAAFYSSSSDTLHSFASELAESIIQKLHSPLSNDELQNDFFELLGFDRYELIKDIFHHRNELVLSKAKVLFGDKSNHHSNDDKRPAILCSVTVQSEMEKLLTKQIRKDEKRIQKEAYKGPELNPSFKDPQYLKSIREAELQTARNRPILHHGPRYLPETYTYPNVYDSYAEARSTAAYISGRKMALPEDHKRTNNDMYEEIEIPASKPAPFDVGQKLIPISSLDQVGQTAFPDTKSLNRLQSLVFDVAYHTNENMLVCAPTGAGKTNVAMLTILHVIRSNIENGVVMKDKFKIVYVAPMKALASEMVANFGKRLAKLGIQVKELTGDMQLTKNEILRTQMLVTTPEKWDVVTRKSTGDVALTMLVKLLILDEVHLLDGDRGPVLEALVARTLRQVESSQSMIRILGLSATCPNYVDVARFLRVNPMIGLFFFDDRFRPVPLSKSFVGVKSRNTLQQLRDMDEVCYEKVVCLVHKKHQVMVFVHARNATVQTAMVLRDLAQNNGHAHLFIEEQIGPNFRTAQKAISSSRNKQLRELFDYGFAIHHAGMLRKDRNLVEKYFKEGFVKVLVCTSTLAWGVNLPARAVIIKGTDVYDSKHGAFVDLGVMDVLQIFGRAGRPQYDSVGEGTIITTHSKLNHFVSLMTRQKQIESNFENSLVDHLNAEIALGTVSSVEEGIEWLSYTYMFIRMKANPLVYGLKQNMIQNDSQLLAYRCKLIEKTANRLDKAKMIRYDLTNGYLYTTNLGRTASHFYINVETIDRFQDHLAMRHLSETQVFNLISQAQEFDQLKVRDDELNELDDLIHSCKLVVACGCESKEGRVNILLQTYLSKISVQSFSLLSDQAYVVQNSSRIVRALFEIALRKGYAILSAQFLKVCKMIEKQQWDFQTPLRQFSNLGADVLSRIEKSRDNLEYLKEMTMDEFARSYRGKSEIKTYVDAIPNLIVQPAIQPITNQILRLTLEVTPDFKWIDRVHGVNGSEAFWIWIEDPVYDVIYHFEYFVLPKRQVLKGEIQTLVLTIPLVGDQRPNQYLVRVISDRWLGSDRTFPISFLNLILPHHHLPHTDLLDLQPLPVTALHNRSYELLYKFQYFNPIQTQIFHSLYHTDGNVLLGAPTGSGKTIAAELAMFRVFNLYPKTKVVYIAPLKALVRERMEDWKVRFGQNLKKNVVELTGDFTPDVKSIKAADVIVTTPEKWDGVSRSWQTRNYVKSVSLIIIDEIHLLGEDRGPVLEVIVSRTNFISAHTQRKLRVIGLSTALANATDLANWLGINQVGMYNFKPSVRPVPLEVHVSGYHGKHYCPRMALMNKPTFQAIRTYSPEKPVLIFVSSRRQTRLTAMDLIAFLAAGPNSRQWIHLPNEELDALTSSIRDQNLKLSLAFGIGLHHAGLHENDRKIVEHLFLNLKIQVLIATATLAWGVNLPAHLVVIKGTEYFDGKVQRYVDFPITDVLQMMGRAGRPQFDDNGVAVVLVQDVKKNFYKKFLYEPFPVESSLLQVLPDHLNAEIVAGTISTKQQCLDYMTWTYFFRRLLQNPVYYGLENIDHLEINKYLSGLIDHSLNTLVAADCVEIDEDHRGIRSTVLGRIASYYYLNHKTMQVFRDQITEKVSPNAVLWILCQTHEYAELPVRHNEDLLNSDFAKSCRLPTGNLSYDSPHTKTYLLLQGYFSRLQLPCADYYTDLKSVLDQAIRVTQAMIDVAADRGWLFATLSSMVLLQMILQARWYDDSSLLTLPYIKQHNLQHFRFSLHSSRDVACNPIGTLPELIEAISNRYELLASVLREDLDETQIEEIFQTLKDLPILNVNASVRGWWEDASSEESKQLKLHKIVGSRPDSYWLKVHADQEYILHVDLRRISRRRESTKAITPKFPKLKDEGWFLVLGNSDNNELVAMKRIGCIPRNATHQLIFYTPENIGRVRYTLYLMSDCYLGLDQQYDIFLNVIEKRSIDETELYCSDSDGETVADFEED